MLWNLSKFWTQKCHFPTLWLWKGKSLSLSFSMKIAKLSFLFEIKILKNNKINSSKHLAFKHCSKSLKCDFSLKLHNAVKWGRFYSYPYFTERNQRTEMKDLAQDHMIWVNLSPKSLASVPKYSHSLSCLLGKEFTNTTHSSTWEACLGAA